MPKIPISFAGAAGDVVSAVTHKPSRNMFVDLNLQTGSTNLRAVHGKSGEQTINASGTFLCAITAIYNGSPYAYVLVKTASNLSLYRETTLVGTFTPATGLSAIGACSYRAATNGVNIVFVYGADNGVAGDDFSVNISTGVITAMTADPNYAGFGTARDVVYADSRYFFITAQNVFHGDLKTDPGAGVAFNALSFTALPFEQNEGIGLAYANGLFYAMSRAQTIAYQNVGTTPFTLQQNKSVYVDVGVSFPAAKIVYDNAIYLFGNEAQSSDGIYVISGSSRKRLANKLVYGNKTAFESEWFTCVYNDGDSDIVKFSPTDTALNPHAIMYNVTTGQFNYMSVETSFGIEGYPAYVHYYIDMSYNYAVISLNNGFQGVEYAVVNPAASIEETGGDPYPLEHYFDYIRNASDPLYIKKIRMNFANVANAELFISEDGDTYTSLGKLILFAQADGRNVGEWRRIGRVNSQASFKIVVEPNDSGASWKDRAAIIGGYIEL